MRAMPLVLLTMVGVAMALSLTSLWTFKAEGAITGLAFSDDGHLGVASAGGCAYVLGPNGHVVATRCAGGRISDVSYCCDKFAFIETDGHVLIYNVRSQKWSKISIDKRYAASITMLTPTNFVACGSCAYLARECEARCGYFDASGTLYWSIDVGAVIRGPASFAQYLYVPAHECFGCGTNEALIVDKHSGRVINKLGPFVDKVWSSAVCGNYLALGLSHALLFYSLENPAFPKLLWKKGGFNQLNPIWWSAGVTSIAFAPGCRYLAAVDGYSGNLYIMDIHGNVVYKKGFSTRAYAVAWWRNEVAVGLYDGRVIVFSIGGPSYCEPSVVTITKTEVVTTTRVLTVTETLVVTKTVYR